ncbi:hypothetical protein KEM52_005279 [Ascosphaera acerosa]|nr:hypothetical protein KEM52_005279 [Ascosphaera acerosa]
MGTMEKENERPGPRAPGIGIGDNDGSQVAMSSGSEDELSHETPGKTATATRGKRAVTIEARVTTLPAAATPGAASPAADTVQAGETQAQEEADRDKTPLQLRHSGRKRRPPKWMEDSEIAIAPQRRTPTPRARKAAAAPASSGSRQRRARTAASKGGGGEEAPSEEAQRPASRDDEPATVPQGELEVLLPTARPPAQEESVYEHDRQRPPEGPEGTDGAGVPGAESSSQRREASDRPDGVPTYVSALAAYLQQPGAREQLRPHVQFALEKLAAKRPIPLQGLGNEFQTVLQLVEQTVTAGEGNSLLLLGPRGAGKSAMVNAAIREISAAHAGEFHVVRLNGFLQIDDRVALREIWKQLGREMDAEAEFAATSASYADTMASLLALLSHPEEIYGAPENDGEGEGADGGLATATSVIFVMEEFDLFAQHPRQTLLYNLFDIAQSRKAPISVIGLTTKVEVTDMLEKRVKSRYSHRYVFVPRPRDLATFTAVCKAALLSEQGQTGDLLAGARQDLLSEAGTATPATRWDAYVHGLFDDPAMRARLQVTFLQSSCPSDFFSAAYPPISKLLCSFSDDDDDDDDDGSDKDLTSIIPTPSSFHFLTCPDPAPLPFPSTASSMSTTPLPLSLLLAATRLAAIHSPNSDQTGAHSSSSTALPLSFAVVYAEYVRLLTSAKFLASVSGAAATSGRVWSKAVAREAWEKLADCALIVPVVQTSGSEAAGDLRMFRVEISFEEVLAAVGEQSSGALGRWWRET